MDCGDEGRKFDVAQVLDFVDRDEQTALPLLGGFASSHEDIGEVIGEIAAVGLSLERVDVDGDLSTIGQLKGERLQNSQSLEHLGGLASVVISLDPPMN